MFGGGCLIVQLNDAYDAKSRVQKNGFFAFREFGSLVASDSLDSK